MQQHFWGAWYTDCPGVRCSFCKWRRTWGRRACLSACSSSLPVTGTASPTSVTTSLVRCAILVLWGTCLLCFLPWGGYWVEVGEMCIVSGWPHLLCSCVLVNIPQEFAAAALWCHPRLVPSTALVPYPATEVSWKEQMHMAEPHAASTACRQSPRRGTCRRARRQIRTGPSWRQSWCARSCTGTTRTRSPTPSCRTPSSSRSSLTAASRSTRCAWGQFS